MDRGRLIEYEVCLEKMREYIMKSSIPINEVQMLIGYINLVEEGDCCSESFFLPKEYTNKELKRVLEMI